VQGNWPAVEAKDKEAAGRPKANRRALSELAPLVYDDLRRLARRYMRNEGPCHTLQPTALVHEAFIRLQATQAMTWAGRSHFFATAAMEMRRVLVDHARRARAQKRGGGVKLALTDDQAVSEELSLDVLALDEALARLEALHPRQARIAELRLFAGMTAEESSKVVGVAIRTAKQDWRVARAWLALALRGSDARHG
jgi:RNA polymerase sigma factor (TIGR02999 family)